MRLLLNLLGWFGVVIGFALMLAGGLTMPLSLQVDGPSPFLGMGMFLGGMVVALGSGLWLDRDDVRSILRNRR